MNDKTEALLAPLKVALEMEQEGMKLFSEAAKKATGRHARETFEFLVGEESKHIERIRKFYESVEASDGTEPPDVDETAAERNLETFNRKLAELRGELQPTSSDAEAYRFALDFENGAEEFYQTKMNETDNEHVRQYYRWLIHEEDSHSKILKSCLDFAENPARWFEDHQ